MSSRDRVPPELLSRVAADLAPVRPLAPPAWRAAWVALLGLAALLGTAAVAGVREDAAGLGPWLSWGAAAVELAAGVLLVMLALREAVPGAGTTTAGVAAALAGAAAVQAAVAVVTWMRGDGATAVCTLSTGVHCLAMEAGLGLPALILTGWLALRALPLRPGRAGVLGGAGAGLLADGGQHLVCPYSDLGHVLIWHAGAIVVLAVTGWAAGALLARVRARGPGGGR